MTDLPHDDDDEFIANGGHRLTDEDCLLAGLTVARSAVRARDDDKVSDFLERCSRYSPDRLPRPVAKLVATYRRPVGQPSSRRAKWAKFMQDPNHVAAFIGTMYKARLRQSVSGARRNKLRFADGSMSVTDFAAHKAVDYVNYRFAVLRKWRRADFNQVKELMRKSRGIPAVFMRKSRGIPAVK